MANLEKDLKNPKLTFFSGIDLTDKTVDNIRKLIKESRKSPAIRQTAETLLARSPEKDWTDEIKNVFEFVKTNIRYTMDIKDTETVKSPDRMLMEINYSGLTYGDCDDHVSLLGALLFNIGYSVRPVIMQSPYNKNEGYNHIFLQVQIPNTAKWISIDPTAKNEEIGYVPEFVRVKIYDTV